jgi:RNA polymerase sigma-32 factor
LHPDHVTEIAERLGVPEQEVVNMNRRLGGQDSSLNAPLKSDSETDWQDMLVDDDIDQEAQLAEQSEMDLRRELLVEAMQGLNEREQHILTERRLQDSATTLEELSQTYDISRERVRQIEARAFEKLQKAMRNAMRERMVESEQARDSFSA